MKRYFPLIPFVLFLFLNSCGEVPEGITPAEGTAVAQTQTAVMWTPTITSTPDPNESKIVEWLNETLLDADPLESTIDAKYQVVDVTFPVTQGSSPPAIFRVDVRCECALLNERCCIPERIFVLTMRAMKNRAEKVMGQVPVSVNEIKVVCFDHTTQIGVMAASWTYVKDYLLDQLNGYQLGARTYRSSLP